jgi:hypothetical protein
MKSKIIFSLIIILTIFISGCFEFPPSEIQQISATILFPGEKVLNINQSNFINNVTTFGFSYYIRLQNKTAFEMRAWKIPKPKNNVSFLLTAIPTVQNTTYSSGGLKVFNMFPTDICAKKDTKCIESKKNMIEIEVNPVINWLNISVNWSTVKWGPPLG